MVHVTEIHVKGVGTVRHLNNEDGRRLRTCPGANKFILPYAPACGLSWKRFKSLPIDKQREVAQAYNALIIAARSGALKIANEQRVETRQFFVSKFQANFSDFDISASGIWSNGESNRARPFSTPLHTFSFEQRGYR